MKRLICTGLLAFSLLAISIAALAQQKPAELKIGMTTFLSRPAAVFGVPGKAAAQLIIDEINAAGGIGGVKLKAVVIDETELRVDPRHQPGLRLGPRLVGDFPQHLAHPEARCSGGLQVVFPTMTVLDNLRLPGEALVGLRPAEIDARLKQVVDTVPLIEATLSRSAAALPGGQGNMAALTRALMVGTRLLLMDEPFQGLAPALARQYANTLSQLYQLRPDLCVVISKSNRSLLDRVICTTLTLERGEIRVEVKSAQAGLEHVAQVTPASS